MRPLSAVQGERWGGGMGGMKLGGTATTTIDLQTSQD